MERRRREVPGAAAGIAFAERANRANSRDDTRPGNREACLGPDVAAELGSGAARPDRFGDGSEGFLAGGPVDVIVSDGAHFAEIDRVDQHAALLQTKADFGADQAR